MAFVAIFFILAFFTISLTSPLSLSPRFEASSQNETVIAGDTAILVCKVEYLGKHTVVWMNPEDVVISKSIQKISDDTRVSIERQYTQDWNLHIRNIRYQDRGEYKCIVNTTPEPKIKYIQLNVLVPPEIDEETSSDSNIAVREGQTVELICNATGVPTPSIQWYRDTSYDDVAEKEAIMSTKPGEILAIRNISRYCEGSYECVAFNNVKYAVSRIFKVTVVFRPEVLLNTRRLGQYIGKETVLECTVSASPKTICAWEKDGQELRTTAGKYRLTIYDEDPHTITLSLLIHEVTMEDFGQYRCYASNNYGDDFEIMELYESKSPDAAPSIESTTTQQPQQPDDIEAVYPILYATPRNGMHVISNGNKQGMSQRSCAVRSWRTLHVLYAISIIILLFNSSK